MTAGLGMTAGSGMPAGSGFADDTPASDKRRLDFFENKVRPLLVEHCYECHSQASGESSGGLLLDHRESMLQGGLGGPVIVPGDASASLLIRAVEYADFDMQMPPAGKLSDDKIATLKRWIDDGAVDPRRRESVEPASSPAERDPASHWAYVTPQQPDPPSLAGSSSVRPTVRDRIDGYAGDAARQRSLTRAPRCDDETLIRRVYFDLVGTPPSFEQIQRYVDDRSIDKFSRLVDRLLASPAFGERFGRHWLDVARYADTRGYALAGQERELAGSHRYRNWVIRAFAEDMPYDEMIRHQIAADRTDPRNENGHLDAMGFLTLGRRFLNPFDTADDRIDVITRGLLGSTVSCARCHDHKFDPIPTADYYALLGVLRSSEQPDPESAASPLMMVDKDKPRDQPIFIRGQAGQRGDIAPRQFLTALRRKDEPRFSDGSGRFELANRIADPDNPLTARVLVNRVWQILIGRPLVESPSDFGFRTSPPAIPEILDELAVDFARDFSIKRLIRRILHTHVYQQSSSALQASMIQDPDNQFCCRANRRRRDFESLRDSLLVVADHLRHASVAQSIEIVTSPPPPVRTIYARIDRQDLPGLFRTFDFANPDAHSSGRFETTVPQQGLFMMNHAQMFFLSRKIAGRVADSEDPIGQLFQQVLGRSPTPSQRQRMQSFLQQPARSIDVLPDAATFWSYGLSRLKDGELLEPINFEPFDHRTERRYQSAAVHPTDDERGHAFLDADGGHVPRDPSWGVVRRWRVPQDGQLSLRMHIEHPSKEGDGVIFNTHVDGRRRWSFYVRSAKQPRGPFTTRVREGEVIDFVASANENDHFDSFRWRVTMSLRTDEGDLIETRSDGDFSLAPSSGPTTPPSRLAQAAQVLLMSNEFAFVD